MLDLDDDSVYTNVFYALPVASAALLGPLELLVVLLASCFLSYRSARYHTTYDRPEQAGDVSAMLTYLSALGAVLASPWSSWSLLLPVAAAVLHERYVWAIDSYVAAPIYIGLCLVVLGLQAGPLHAAPAAVFALAGGAVKLLQPGPRTRLHSLWHVCGGLSAASALAALALV